MLHISIRSCRRQRAFASQLGMGGWTWRIARLPPGMLGWTDHQAMTITLAPGQTQRQLRCTVAHEIGHAERPPFVACYTAMEERFVDQMAARRLVPVEQLLDAHRWAHNLAELADECWVDEPTILVRLQYLCPSERLKLMVGLDDRTA